MSFEVTLEMKGLDKLTAELVPKADRVVDRAANRVLAQARKSFSGGKSGRDYTRGGKSHQASGPGQPPAIDTGNLTNSIAVEPKVYDMQRVVAVGAEYGLYLELGTRYMGARPFLMPAFEKVQPLFEREVEALFDA